MFSSWILPMLILLPFVGALAVTLGEWAYIGLGRSWSRIDLSHRSIFSRSLTHFMEISFSGYFHHWGVVLGIWFVGLGGRVAIIIVPTESVSWVLWIVSKMFQGGCKSNRGARIWSESYRTKTVTTSTIQTRSCQGRYEEASRRLKL